MKRIIFSNLVIGKKKTSVKAIMNLIGKNKLFSLLVLFLLVGMAFGAYYARFADENTLINLDFFLASNFKMRTDPSIITTFMVSLTSSFIFILTAFLMSLCVYGTVLLPLLPFYRGFGIGLTAGYLYSTYGLKGIGFHFLVLLPGVFISAVGIIMSTRESILLSIKLAEKVFPNSNLDKVWPNFKSYLKKSGYIIIILCIAAGIDLIFSGIFAKMFSF